MIRRIFILALLLTFLISWLFTHFKISFQPGPELILYNAIISYLLLMTIRKKEVNVGSLVKF